MICEMMSNENYIGENELMHYGVLGMKWGVRRGKAQLAKARTTGDRNRHDRGVAKLNKHKKKIDKKIDSLDGSITRLQKKRNKQIQTSDYEATRLSSKAAKLNQRATNPFITRKRADNLMRKATLTYIKADTIKAKSRETQALIDKCKTEKSIFEKGASDIDRMLMDYGKDFIEKIS